MRKLRAKGLSHLPKTHKEDVAAPDWAWRVGVQRKVEVGGGSRLSRGSLRLCPPPPAEQLTVVGKISFNPKDVLGRGASGTFVFR